MNQPNLSRDWCLDEVALVYIYPFKRIRSFEPLPWADESVSRLVCLFFAFMYAVIKSQGVHSAIRVYLHFLLYLTFKFTQNDKSISLSVKMLHVGNYLQRLHFHNINKSNINCMELRSFRIKWAFDVITAFLSICKQFVECCWRIVLRTGVQSIFVWS